MHKGRERGREVGGAGSLEIIGRCCVPAREDVARIVKGHLLKSREEDLFGQRSGLLGGTVHANFELVHFLAHPQHAETATNRFEFGW